MLTNIHLYTKKEMISPYDDQLIGKMNFRYSGKPGDYENVSLIDVLNGNVPATAFDDCIVLVGAYAAGMMDSYFVPVDRSSQMFGVEIHANVIQAIIEGKKLQDVNKVIDALISALIIIYPFLKYRFYKYN